MEAKEGDDGLMVQVSFVEEHEVADTLLRYSVIMAFHQHHWIFCKHKQRTSLEIPGGHRESGESIDDCARRELYEETGAVEFELTRIGVYGVKSMDAALEVAKCEYGMLYLADIKELDALPESEIECIVPIHSIQGITSWTYPEIQPFLFEQVQHKMRQQYRFELLSLSQKEKISEVLHGLPEWFGIESATQTYIEQSLPLPVLGCVWKEHLLGFVSIKETSSETMEVYVMGVLPCFHRQKIGSELMRKTKQYALEHGATFLQVKTLSPIVQNAGYLKTYAFYRQEGFCDVEVLDLWDEGNPCLLMIQKVGDSNGISKK